MGPFGTRGASRIGPGSFSLLYICPGSTITAKWKKSKPDWAFADLSFSLAIVSMHVYVQFRLIQKGNRF